MKLNSNQVDIMYHTKHRASTKGLSGTSSPDADMKELVSLGLMESRGKVSFCPDEWFALTEKGDKVLSKFRP